MCQVLNAELEIVRFRNGCKPSYKCARIQVTRILESNTKKHVRGALFGIFCVMLAYYELELYVLNTLISIISVSVIGSVESGKSTLIGVLTRGCLDDGNGLARMQVFRYNPTL